MYPCSSDNGSLVRWYNAWCDTHPTPPAVDPCRWIATRYTLSLASGSMNWGNTPEWTHQYWNKNACTPISCQQLSDNFGADAYVTCQYERRGVRRLAMLTL